MPLSTVLPTLQEDSRTITILLVDDDAEQREYLAFKFLERVRCQVLNAKSVDEALALLEKHEIDIVITDYLMPEGEGTGVDLLKIINARSGPSPVLMLTTGYPDFLPDEVFNQIATVFCKPFSADRLINIALTNISSMQIAEAA